jgi:hypothetical protein
VSAPLLLPLLAYRYVAWQLTPLITKVREGRLELPRPLGHRILRLLALRSRFGPTCRLVSFRVVPCPCVSSCREQDVSKGVIVALQQVSRAMRPRWCEPAGLEIPLDRADVTESDRLEDLYLRDRAKASVSRSHSRETAAPLKNS